MEVGAVKQAFNNETILLKKKLNQARIQIIHKLTRRAKTLVEKKAPENIKEKFKRKAEAAVKEVLIVKKIKPKDLTKFIVIHKGQLQSYLNKPDVDQDKACARLLLHKSLQDKYKFIRDRFSNVPIEDLLMSREERKKLKKEAREKQKNKMKGKANNNVVNAEGEWDVEDVEMSNGKRKLGDEEESDEGEAISRAPETSDEEDNSKTIHASESSDEEDNSNTIDVAEDDSDDHEEGDVNRLISKSDDDVSIEEATGEDNDIPSEAEEVNEVGKFVNLTPQKPVTINNKTNLLSSQKPIELNINKKELKKLENKTKDKIKNYKNKNLNDKLLKRKFKKDIDENPSQEVKVVDPFFITETGENYMSVVEPRQPDEVKEEHKQGNRKLRRAVMFGHVPKTKPRRNDFGHNDNRFNRNDNSYNKESYKNFNNKESYNDKKNFTNKRNNFSSNSPESKPEKQEKLHPSWEAKKKQSGILPFQGKKIIFDES